MGVVGSMQRIDTEYDEHVKDITTPPLTPMKASKLLHVGFYSTEEVVVRGGYYQICSIQTNGVYMQLFTIVKWDEQEFCSYEDFWKKYKLENNYK